MKKILILIYFLNGVLCLSAQTSLDFRKTASHWEGVASEQEKQQAFEKTIAAWNQLPEYAKEAEWMRLALIYIERSRNALAKGEVAQAAKSLRQAGELNRQFNGRLEFATKSPNYFFPQLAKLQAVIAAATGADPLAGLVDYVFVNEGNNKFMVARQEIYNEIDGITLDGIKPMEALVQVLQISVRNGHATIEKSRWLVGPKGNTENPVQCATKEVFDEKVR